MKMRQQSVQEDVGRSQAGTEENPAAIADVLSEVTSQPESFKSDGSPDQPRTGQDSLDQKLARFDPERHGGEAMPWGSVGQERI